MITLTTDFGDSEYVGAMKGTIHSINPETLVVDITHNIQPFDIRHAAYVLYSTFQYFPEKTVHVAVIDPGVGTKRRGIIIESKKHIFIGPDNGVFSLIEAENVYEIGKKSQSSTFHGRDVFAPIAARIDSGESPKDYGKRIKSYKRTMRDVVAVSNRVKGKVFCADVFGNIITNIKRTHTIEYGLVSGGEIKVNIAGRIFEMPFVDTYGEVERGQLAGLINSTNHFEVSVREGNASDMLNAYGGEVVEIFS